MLNTERIKARLDELNMTQADLATVISVAVPTMCQKINNIRPLSLDEAEKIAKALRIEDKDFGTYFLANKLRSAILKTTPGRRAGGVREGGVRDEKQRRVVLCP